MFDQGRQTEEEESVRLTTSKLEIRKNKRAKKIRSQVKDSAPAQKQVHTTKRKRKNRALQSTAIKAQKSAKVGGFRKS